jgi:hypothetical protein
MAALQKVIYDICVSMGHYTDKVTGELKSDLITIGVGFRNGDGSINDRYFLPIPLENKRVQIPDNREESGLRWVNTQIPMDTVHFLKDKAKKKAIPAKKVATEPGDIFDG